MDIETFAGFGLGLRKEHYGDFLSTPQPVDFVEVISENFMNTGGQPLSTLLSVRERCPVALHGVSMSLGTRHSPPGDYLVALKALASAVDPLWISDHLCWTGIGGHGSHDLLPLPLTEEALGVCVENVHRVQETLGRSILIENPSTYVTFPESMMTEWEFLTELTAATGCYLLLDVNNMYVSSVNHGFDPYRFLRNIPRGRVRQIHLAGHSEGPGGLLIDTHDSPVCDPVWALYAAAVACMGNTATMIERDDAIPPLADLLNELESARRLARTYRCAA